MHFCWSVTVTSTHDSYEMDKKNMNILHSVLHSCQA